MQRFFETRSCRQIFDHVLRRPVLVHVKVLRKSIQQQFIRKSVLLLLDHLHDRVVVLHVHLGHQNGLGLVFSRQSERDAIFTRRDRLLVTVLLLLCNRRGFDPAIRVDRVSVPHRNRRRTLRPDAHHTGAVGNFQVSRHTQT